MDEAMLRRQVARLVEALGGRRRLLAAGLLAVAVAAGLRALAPAAPATREVWAAARDLPGGRPLAAADVRPVDFPVAGIPDGALLASTPVAGRLLAAPVRRGEPLTDVRLLGPALLAALDEPGLVAVPVRVSDAAAAAALVRAGDIVDVLSVADPAGGVRRGGTVAEAVRVLSVAAGGSGGGGIVVVAASQDAAGAIARASAASQLSLILRHP